MHSWLDTILEAYIAYILTREYYFGRSDTDLKREETRKAKKRVDSAQVSNSGGKKDMALGPTAQDSPKQSPSGEGAVEVRKVYGPSDTNFLYNPPGKKIAED